MKFVFAILCLVVVSKGGLADDTCEDHIKQCQSEVGNVILKLKNIQETGKDADNYCLTVELEPKCVKDVTSKCKADFTSALYLLSVSVSKALLYKSEFCGENGKKYMEVAPCLLEKKVFQKCDWKEVDPKEMMCELVDYMTCTAKFSKDNCKNGEDYGKALEERMKIKKGVCSNNGAGYLANSFWTFATTVLSALLIKNKMQ